MMRLRLAILGVLCVPLCGGLALGQDVFTLGFQGQGSFTAPAGTAVSGEYICTVAQEGTGPGAQGWSISVSANGAAISAITTAGTDAAALYDGGFEKTELTTAGDDECAGRSGAVSATVLSFTLPIKLDPAVVSSVAKLTVGATVPAGGGAAELVYVNGCQGAGQPVDNKITQEGATREPVRTSKTIQLVEKITCAGAQLTAGFTEDAVTGAGDLATFVGDEASGGEIEVQANPGTKGVGVAFAGIASILDPTGAQGWSVSIALEGEGALTGATTAGTTAAPAPDGLQSGGFEKTELVDPAKEPTGGPLKGLGPQGPGAVSAIVLSFTQPIVLPAVGVESVLKLTVEAAAEQTEADQLARLFLKDGLQGAGQPVSNVVTVAGATKAFCNRATADVTLVFTPSREKLLVRGNANDDGKVNIADPIWIIGELFYAGPPTVCQDAADANDDGAVDSSDVTLLIAYLFQAGPTPPAPFDACGPDSTEDTLVCDTTQSACD